MTGIRPREVLDLMDWDTPLCRAERYNLAIFRCPSSQGPASARMKSSSNSALGGMGEICKGTDTRLDRTVAIKVLPDHAADDPDLRQRLEQEAKTISSLNHPHICTLDDLGQQDGRTCWHISKVRTKFK